MLAAMDRAELPENLLLLIDRRDAAPPTIGFIRSMAAFFSAHEERLVGARAAVLVNRGGGTEPLFDVRVGRFRIRSFDDVTGAVQWLGADLYDPAGRNAA